MSRRTNETIDLAQLRELSGDDNEFVIEILEIFSDTAPEALTEMVNHFENREGANLKSVAHKFKSSVNILGSSRLLELLNKIETAATSGLTNPDETKTWLDETLLICHDFIDQVAEELDNLRRAA